MPGKQRLRGEAMEQRRLRVYAAWCLGKSQVELAAIERVDQSQISRDLADMFHRQAGASPKETDKNRLEMLGRIAHTEAELLAAWERSKKPKQRTKGKKVDLPAKFGRPNKKGVAPKITPQRREAETITEGRDGNPRFVEALKALWELKAKILGLIQNKVDITTGGEPLHKLYGFDPNHPDPADAGPA